MKAPHANAVLCLARKGAPHVYAVFFIEKKSAAFARGAPGRACVVCYHLGYVDHEYHSRGGKRSDAGRIALGGQSIDAVIGSF